jgi:hypothetical protein
MLLSSILLKLCDLPLQDFIFIASCTMRSGLAVLAVSSSVEVQKVSWSRLLAHSVHHAILVYTVVLCQVHSLNQSRQRPLSLWSICLLSDSAHSFLLDGPCLYSTGWHRPCLMSSLSLVLVSQGFPLDCLCFHDPFATTPFVRFRLQNGEPSFILKGSKGGRLLRCKSLAGGHETMPLQRFLLYQLCKPAECIKRRHGPFQPNKLFRPTVYCKLPSLRFQHLK